MNIEKQIIKDHESFINKFKLKHLTVIFIVVMFVIVFNFWPNQKGMFIYFIDVGQGDCILVQDYNYTFMIDGGGDRFMDDDNNIGKCVVFPFLLDKGIDHLDCVFVTHVHYDHIKGVIELIDLVDIDTIVLPIVYNQFDLSNSDKDVETSKEDDFVVSVFKGGDELFLLEELLDKAVTKEIKVLFMSEGEVISGKSSQFTCIYPYKSKTYSEHENENSLVLKLELGGVTTLLTGDIEEEGEKWMVSHQPTLKNINILKVPHHGSNSSSTEEFLIKLNPDAAIASVGENLFGHPSDIVKMRYNNLNIPFYSTKKYGMIEVIIEDNYYKIEPYKGELINESTKRTIKD